MFRRQELWRTFAIAAALGLVGGVSSRAAADDDDEVEAPSAQATPVEFAPGLWRAPYVQAVGCDSALVVWDAPGNDEAFVDFGPDTSYPYTARATTDRERRVAVLRGLTPGGDVHYRVRQGDRVLAGGPGYSFRTNTGVEDRTFTFFVTGDIGDKKGRQALTAASILAAPTRPEFGLLCGDIVYSRGESALYNRNLMHPWAGLLAAVPVWPALGNHDWKSDPESNFRREWYLPGNEHWFSFQWGNAHFVALDTRDGEIYDPEAQLAWLENELTAHQNAAWTFVYYHHPGITCTYKKNEPSVEHRILPILDRFEVDVVFNGHAHTYERLYPLRAGKPVDVEQDPNYVDPKGTVYVVSGAGGKTKKKRPTTFCGPTAFFKDETLCWTQVTIDGARCTIRTVQSVDGALIDEMTITKTSLEGRRTQSP